MKKKLMLDVFSTHATWKKKLSRMTWKNI